MAKTKVTIPAKATSYPETSTIRLSEADWQVIEKLRAKTGIRSWSDLVRKALRDSAEKEGLAS